MPPSNSGTGIRLSPPRLTLMMARNEINAVSPRYALMPANSAMLIGPLMFFAETCPVTIRQSICTVSEDMSQVFTTPRTTASTGPERRIAKTWDMSSLTVQMLWRIVTGQVSAKNISGPISIAEFAGISAYLGLTAFLAFLAIISVSLGVLNLMPVPLLDGGQGVYQVVEAIKGTPLSERAQR